MLKKLLKYDIKSYANTLLPIFGLTLLLAVFSRIFMLLKDLAPVFRVPMGLVMGLAMLLTSAVPFITFVIGIDRFNKQMTKDEGYLTHKKTHNNILKTFNTNTISNRISNSFIVFSMYNSKR